MRVNPSKLRSREDVVQKAFKLNLSINGTVAVLKERIATHLTKEGLLQPLSISGIAPSRDLSLRHYKSSIPV